MTDIDSLHQEFNELRRRMNEVERKIELIDSAQGKVLEAMQGDDKWKRKGILDQLVDIAAFMQEMRTFNFSEMKQFASEYNDFKKRVLWLCAGLMALVTVTGTVLSNVDKIQSFFHH